MDVLYESIDVVKPARVIVRFIVQILINHAFVLISHNGVKHDFLPSSICICIQISLAELRRL